MTPKLSKLLRAHFKELSDGVVMEMAKDLIRAHGGNANVIKDRSGAVVYLNGYMVGVEKRLERNGKEELVN